MKIIKKQLVKLLYANYDDTIDYNHIGSNILRGYILTMLRRNSIQLLMVGIERKIPMKLDITEVFSLL